MYSMHVQYYGTRIVAKMEAAEKKEIQKKDTLDQRVGNAKKVAEPRGKRNILGSPRCRKQEAEQGGK